ncbi:MAG: GWxTD domain-containing protein [Chlorobi bacterium]|nr:GWxTD domain-containing protein [Chlorobiota bacterium]MBX7215508.1 GWxTD domain-containing protein [Candidatus Kapabacteria bacterium]
MRQVLLVIGLWAAVVAVPLVGPLAAQSLDRESIFFDAIPFAGRTKDSARMDLYLALPYATLKFERNGGKYQARYQVTFTVQGEGKKWLDTTFTRDLSTASYDATVGRPARYEFFQRKAFLPPGNYTATAEIVDVKNNLAGTIRRNATVRDYLAERFALSGLMLVSKIRENGSGHTITPMFTENISTLPDGYFLFFEAYNNTSDTAFRLTANYSTPKGDPVASLSFPKSLPTGRSQAWVRLPSKNLAKGLFNVELKATTAADTNNALATSARLIRVAESLDGMPLTEAELDEKIVQLRYVATQSEVDDIRSGSSFDEKKRRYAAFWERLDPTTGTQKNEAMIEYFRRIEYANDKFRSYAAGWLTDMGRVYIIYGQPDNVQRDPFRRDGRAVEVWQYYGQRNLRLTFVDDNGFGDYRLATAIPLGDKYQYKG